ncbi:hypothetical protein D1007_54823 [Hordeum vulgare]|nr:hypothetical protein D1007_54823 [Hordeum vulgare]
MAEAHGDAGAAARDVVELQGVVTADDVKDYDSGEDVYKGNFKSFKAKEVEKTKAKGVAFFFNRKIKKWRCP